jgi:serine protease
LAAVNLALRPVVLASVPATAAAGSTVTLDASRSAAASGRSLASFKWTASAGSLANADQSKATLVVGSTGTVSVSLVVTDDAGATDSLSTNLIVYNGRTSSSSIICVR